VASGAVGLRVIETATEDEEATCIALLLREVKATPGKTAALVTPSAALVQRVAVKLARFGIVPQTSIGTPMAETEIGALILALADLCADPAQPAGLYAVAASPLVQTDMAALVRHVLRGPRRWAGLDQLLALAPAPAQPAAAALVAALTPLAGLAAAETDLGAAATAMAQTLEALCAPESPWQGPAGAVAAEVLRGLVQEGAALGSVRLEALPRLMRRLLAGAEVPPTPGGDPAVALLGPLEARLIRPDRVILGDLNEGAWPAPPPEDMFLSRSLRASLGLPPPEVRIGLAAHDFAQLCQAPEVFMTRAARRAGAPSVASRWVWRV
jgi:ATP-dependent helicase/nuclease subunit B